MSMLKLLQPRNSRLGSGGHALPINKLQKSAHREVLGATSQDKRQVSGTETSRNEPSQFEDGTIRTKCCWCHEPALAFRGQTNGGLCKSPRLKSPSLLRLYDEDGCFVRAFGLRIQNCNVRLSLSTTSLADRKSSESKHNPIRQTCR